MNSTNLNGPIKIATKVGDRELLTSGVVHLEGESPIEITIDSLKFRFIFQSDEQAPRFTGTLKDDTLEFILFNHKNALGEGKLNPIEIATLNGRMLSFTYFVNTLSSENNARRFEYSFYLGGKSD